MLAIVERQPHYKASLKKNLNLSEKNPKNSPFYLPLTNLLYLLLFFTHFRCQNLNFHPFILFKINKFIQFNKN